MQNCDINYFCHHFHDDGLVKDATPVCKQWSYVFLALTHQYKTTHIFTTFGSSGHDKHLVKCGPSLPFWALRPEHALIPDQQGTEVVHLDGRLQDRSENGISQLWYQHRVNTQYFSSRSINTWNWFNFYKHCAVFNPGLTKRGSFLTPSLQIWGSFGKSGGQKNLKRSSDRV